MGNNAKVNKQQCTNIAQNHSLLMNVSKLKTKFFFGEGEAHLLKNNKKCLTNKYKKLMFFFY